MQKGQHVVKDILTPSNSNRGKLELLHLELDSLQSVRDCAEHFLNKSCSLNILVNNAGKQLSICHVAVLILQDSGKTVQPFSHCRYLALSLQAPFTRLVKGPYMPVCRHEYVLEHQGSALCCSLSGFFVSREMKGDHAYASC